MTAIREGFGSYIARGARELGKSFGVENEAVQVNGLEVAYHDPRGASGMAIVYATSPVGASHNQSDYYNVDIGQADNRLGFGLPRPERRTGKGWKHSKTSGLEDVYQFPGDVPIF